MYKKLLLGYVASKVGKVFRFFLLLGLSFVILFPIIYMISMSFRPLDDLFDPSVVWISRGFTFSNFAAAFRNLDYINSFVTTLLIAGVSSLIQTASCCLIAYGFARFQFRGKNLLFAMVLLTIIVPPQVTIIPLYLMFKNFGIPFIGTWLEDLLGVYMTVNLIDNPVLFYMQALLGMGIRSGLYIFILRHYFSGFPRELEEAAEIDGCSAFGTFTRVFLPNAGSMLMTVTLFSIVWYWNDYFYTSTFLGKTQTLAVALSFLRVNLAEEMGQVNNVYESTAQMQAGCLLFIIPLLILYVFLQRYFVQGIERSGIVG